MLKQQNRNEETYVEKKRSRERERGYVEKKT